MQFDVTARIYVLLRRQVAPGPAYTIYTVKIQDSKF